VESLLRKTSKSRSKAERTDQLNLIYSKAVIKIVAMAFAVVAFVSFPNAFMGLIDRVVSVIKAK
jgi:hypothetical protein